ncbi:hypothetical protein CTI12_AA535630 [Artemisia annua]|uniref:Homeodomain-like protein n=1 Tax=Artemisia annua TaxID=35608 RepID=A0A2U1L2J1_ARTAN|nr:hypothetical protein CTI12_AA535630 [Artemisia annua]
MDQIERPWSPEEDEMLENLIEKHGHNWIRITKSIPGRLGQSCELRWWFLYRPFTPEEDEMLENLFEKHGSNWSLNSKSIPGRSGQSCKLRWLWSFTPGEDEMLLKLIDKHGRNWSLISKSGRSVMSCELRWLSLQGSFTLEEDEMLLKLVDKHGRNWSLISKSIPGRSAKSCESRWLFFHSSLFMPEEDQTNEDTTISDHNIFVRAPSVSDINRGKRNSYIHDLNLSLALGGVSNQAPSFGEMARDNVSQPSGGYNRMPTLKSLFPLSGHERPQDELKKLAVLDKQKIYTTASTTETLWNLNTKGTQDSIWLWRLDTKFHSRRELKP